MIFVVIYCSLEVTLTV